jgi:hypothetical protein
MASDTDNSDKAAPDPTWIRELSEAPLSCQCRRMIITTAMTRPVLAAMMMGHESTAHRRLGPGVAYRDNAGAARVNP